MRRAPVLVVVVVACAAVVAAASGDGAESAYRVDAEFDRLSGLVTDQDVRVAGAKVGKIVEIGLTGERNALIGMEVEPGFAPFRADARCTIRQDSLLGEKFVQCDPGTPDAPELRARGDGAPTVPVARTEVPVDIDLILGLSRLPYRERLRILLTELGVGLAGRGAELNAAIRRANPALREANEVLRTVGRDRDGIRRLVEGTNEALGELARRGGRVQSLVERADRATSAAASRRDELDESIRRLPELLAELEPSADRLAALAREGTPALRDLRAAAADLDAFLAEVPPLSDAAGLALDALGEAAPAGRRASRSALPLTRRLGTAATELPDIARTATELNESVLENGGIEGLLRSTYYGSASAARFDPVSHLLPSYQLSRCGIYATEPSERCNAHFAGASDSGGTGRAETRRTRAEPVATSLMDWLLGP